MCHLPPNVLAARDSERGQLVGLHTCLHETRAHAARAPELSQTVSPGRGNKGARGAGSGGATDGFQSGSAGGNGRGIRERCAKNIVAFFGAPARRQLANTPDSRRVGALRVKPAEKQDLRTGSPTYGGGRGSRDKTQELAEIEESSSQETSPVAGMGAGATLVALPTDTRSPHLRYGHLVKPLFYITTYY